MRKCIRGVADDGVPQRVDLDVRRLRQSRNRVVDTPIVAPSNEKERNRIDAMFEAMAVDEEYLALMRQVDAEWGPGSDEAMREIAREEAVDGVTY